jgi:tetratricopeptide (TPR) repeat protein
MNKKKINKVLIVKNAQKFTQKGKFDKAISEWEKLLPCGFDSRVYNAIGDLYLKLEKSGEAIGAFKKSAEAYRENELNLKAIAMYTKVLNLQPSDVDSRIAQAELNAEMGLIGNAVDNYLAAAEHNLIDNKTDIAVELYKKALDLAPRNINLRVRVAVIYTELGLIENAVKVYEDAATVFLSSGDYDRAKMMFLKAVSADPERTHSLIGLSIIEERAGNLLGAFRYAKEALSFAPGDNDAVARFSDLSVKSGSTDDAVKIISALLEKGTPHIQLRKSLVSVYINAGMAEKAWEELLPAIDDLFKEEKRADAMELLELFKEVEVAEVRARVAGIYKDRGNIEAAVCEFKETAWLFRKKGDVDGELRSYQEAIEVAPGDEEILERIETLQSSCGKDMPVVPGAADETGDEVIHRPEEVEAAGEENTVPHIPDNIEEVKPEIIESESAPAAAVTEETPGIEETETPFRSDGTGPVLKEANALAIPGVIEKKMREAEFYEHYGFVNEAVNVFEELLLLSPEDKELAERLMTLKSSLGIKNRTGERTAQGEHLDGSCDNSTESIIRDFNEVCEQEIPENPETHYELGFAYIEMGLMEDAVKEFRIASNDPLIKIRCWRVIARCYAEEGKYGEAIEEFEKIVSDLSDNGEECLDIQYDLADMYLKNSEYDNALKLYSEIQSRDAGYRDVAAKIKEVRGTEIDD